MKVMKKECHNILVYSRRTKCNKSGICSYIILQFTSTDIMVIQRIRNDLNPGEKKWNAISLPFQFLTFRIMWEVCDIFMYINSICISIT